MTTSRNTITEKCLIPGPVGALEAIINFPAADASDVSAAPTAVAIICHPHPLQGGTMQNKVVSTLMRTYVRQGITAIQFNFRGVGKSEGEFDNAFGEADDCRAVIHYVEQRWPDAKLYLSGFSFGSFVAYKVAREFPLQQLISVAPPVHHYDFTAYRRPDCPWIVIMGDQDEVVPAEQVYDWLASITPPAILLRFPEAGHFFHGQLLALQDALNPHFIRSE